MKRYLYSILFFYCLFFLTDGRAQTAMGGCTAGSFTLTQCGGTYADPGGNANYGNNANCTQTICAGVAGQCVTIQFTSFNLENGFDFLTIYNGNSTAAPVLANNLTGTNLPGQFTATTGCLTIKFTSDGSVTAPGWVANIICTPCGSPPPPPPGPVVAGDCASAVNVCTNGNFQIDPNGSGNTVDFTSGSISNPSINPASGNSGCLLSGELNSTWMIINIATSGNLEFAIGNANSTSINCLDWIMWPYSGPATCTQINNNQLAPVRCNWNGLCEQYTGISANPIAISGDPVNFEPPLAVTCGQKFIICLSNYSSASTSIPLVFNGSATVSCNTFTPITATSATVCPGVAATLTASGGNTYSWNPGGQTTASITVTPATTTSYTVTGTGPCGTGTATTTVTVLAANNPSCTSTCTVTASNNGPICLGANINLSATAVAGATSYSWTGPNAFSASGQNATLTAPAVTATGIYTVTVVSGSATCTSTTSVVVNPLPVATASSNSPVCQNGTLNLSASGGTSYVWSGPNNFTSLVQNPVISSVTSAASGTYTVTVTSAANCVSTATVAVTINPLPTPTASSNTPVCQNGTLNLTGGGGGTYAWTGPNGFTSPTQSPSIPNVSTAGSGTYTLTVTSAPGCIATTTTAVTINPLPTPIASSNTPVCQNGTLNLTGGGGGAYAWTGPNGFTSSTQSPSVPNVSTAASGTYTLTVTSAANCVATTTTPVTINPLPTPTATNNSPLCNAGTLNLSGLGGGSYSWSGPNNFSSPLQNPSITNVTTINAGTYTLTVTSAANCVATATTSVIINPTLIVSAGNNGPLCAGNTLTITASTGASWSWTGPNGFTSNQQNPSLPNATPSMSGTYSVTATDAFGCVGTASTTAIVNALPTPVITGNSPLCANQTLILNVNSAGTYSWTGPNSFTSSNQSPTIPGATTAASGTYSLTIIDANNCQAQATFPVTVNPLPIVTVTGSSVCANQTVNLGASGGILYSWSGPNGFTSNIQNPSIPNATTSTAGNYTVTVTDANNCVNANVAIVSVNNAPTPTATSNSPICENQVLNLFGNGGATYAWAGPNGFLSASQNPSINPASLAATGTYTLVATDANNCVGQTTVNVVVNALPIPTASNSGPVCENSIVNFTGSGGSVYTWTGPGNFSSSSQNPLISSASVTASGTYSLVVIDANGCQANTTTNLVVNPNPIPTAGSNSPICLNQLLNLTASGGSNYQWSGPNGFSSASQNPSIANATAAMSGTYSVTVSTAAGCIASTTVLVQVGAPLSISASTSDGTICIGESSNVSAIGQGGNGSYTYQWTGPGGFSASGTTTPVSPNTTTTYTVTVSDGCGTPPVNTTVTIIVNPLPSVLAGPTGISGCAPIAIPFTGLSSPAAVTCNWTFGDGSSTQECNPVHIYSTSGTFIVNYSVIDANGCQNSDTAIVYVYDVPEAEFSFGPQPATTLEPSISFNNLSTGLNLSYFWEMGDANNSTFSTFNPPIFLYEEAGTYYVTLTVETPNGCIDSVTHPVIILDDFAIYIPNAFTPNDDGLNDFFYAKGVGIEKFEIFIFDRWGELIFYADEMDKKWDGTVTGKSGTLVQQDTYVWKAKVKAFSNKNTREFKGTVSVVK